MKRGNLAFGVLAILGLICLFVAATILLNTYLVKKEDKSQSAPSALPVDVQNK